MMSAGEHSRVRWDAAGMSKTRFVSLMVAVSGGAIVVALFRFNQTTASYNAYIVGNLLGLLWVPMLMILLVFRSEPAEFGFGLGSSKRVWPVVAVAFAGMLALLVWVSRWDVFQQHYPWFRHFPEFRAAFWDYPNSNPFRAAPMLMLYAQATYGMYLFCWEFFFRGYLLLGLARSLGWGAIILQAAAFALLHYGKPSTEVAASFVAGIALGLIALNAKSFVPCFLLHWAISVSFDILVVLGRPQAG